nr:hypothetical protein Iba_chr06bCG5820 [Ipomoea batatas]
MTKPILDLTSKPNAPFARKIEPRVRRRRGKWPSRSRWLGLFRESWRVVGSCKSGTKTGLIISTSSTVDSFCVPLVQSSATTHTNDVFNGLGLP